MRRGTIIAKIKLFSIATLMTINCRIGLNFFRLVLEVSKLARALPAVHHVVHTFDRQMVI